MVQHLPHRVTGHFDLYTFSLEEIKSLPKRDVEVVVQRSLEEDVPKVHSSSVLGWHLVAIEFFPQRKVELDAVKLVINLILFTINSFNHILLDCNNE